MQRLERLINLTAALLAAERPLTVDELRERVPGYAADEASSRRAFERDKEALREMGVPVVIEPVGPHRPNVEGYRIHKQDYYLRDPQLAGDELAALHLAASAVRVDGADGVEALWKLGGEVAEGGPAPAVAALPGTDHLAPVFSAISDRRRVSFEYRGRQRLVEPQRLSFRNGHWYLAANDVEAGEPRMYRLDRVDSEVAGRSEPGAFEAAPAAESIPQPWELGRGDVVLARLWVDASQAGWAISHVGTDAVSERRADGSVVLDVKVSNGPAFRSFVLGFLDHAEILGPAELRDDMIEWLEAMCPR